MISKELRELLDRSVELINRPDFINDDPIKYPHQFSSQRDIEIVSFLSSMLAWGNRAMIRRDIERLLTTMEYNPTQFVKEGCYEEIPDEKNIHRTFFGLQLKYLLRGFREILTKYGNIENFALQSGAAASEVPAWHFTEALQRVLLDVNGGKTVERCLPSNLDNTALKRINMAFRWLVRDDGIVDMGIWKGISKSKLYIPLDVHVGNVSRDLGLLTRKSNDRKSVEQLTGQLRELRPDDPVIYDFALFGIGVNANK